MVKCPGDEIDVLNDSWLFLMWSSDHCPYSTNSACSRWPVAVIPKSLYLTDESGINLTVAAATREIVASFNRLSTDGIKLRDVPSMGRSVVTRLCLVKFFPNQTIHLSLMPPKERTLGLGSFYPSRLISQTGGLPQVLLPWTQRRLESFLAGLQPGQALRDRPGAGLVKYSWTSPGKYDSVSVFSNLVSL